MAARPSAPDSGELPFEVTSSAVTGDATGVEIRRSTRRRRTVSAFREGDRMVVLVPARMSAAEVARWVTTMSERLALREAKRRPSDGALAERAEVLSHRYLGGLAQPRSVEWSRSQNKRWGSCTPADASIRISARLEGVPGWVLDYVLLHELTHLLVADHSPRFHELLDAYPKVDRARGFLEGLAFAEDHQRCEEPATD